MLAVCSPQPERCTWTGRSVGSRETGTHPQPWLPVHEEELGWLLMRVPVGRDAGREGCVVYQLTERERDMMTPWAPPPHTPSPYCMC